jgi:hypothetical protein
MLGHENPGGLNRAITAQHRGSRFIVRFLANQNNRINRLSAFVAPALCPRSIANHSVNFVRVWGFPKRLKPNRNGSPVAYKTGLRCIWTLAVLGVPSTESLCRQRLSGD